MTTTEPVWDDWDRGWAEALVTYEALLCSGCGHPLHHTTAPEREDTYEVGPPARCHGCDALQTTQDRYRDADRPSALRFNVRSRDE